MLSSKSDLQAITAIANQSIGKSFSTSLDHNDMFKAHYNIPYSTNFYGI